MNIFVCELCYLCSACSKWSDSCFMFNWHANFCVQLSHEVAPYDIPLFGFICRMKWTLMTHLFVVPRCHMKWTFMTYQFLFSFVAWSGPLWHTNFSVHLSQEVDPYDNSFCVQLSHEVDGPLWRTKFCVKLLHEMDPYGILICVLIVAWNGPLIMTY